MYKVGDIVICESYPKSGISYGDCYYKMNMEKYFKVIDIENSEYDYGDEIWVDVVGLKSGREFGGLYYHRFKKATDDNSDIIIKED